MSGDKPLVSRDVAAIVYSIVSDYLYYTFSSIMPKGKRINSTSKQIICNVYDYFENESKKRKGSVLPKLGKKTSEATGYCK